MMCRNPYIRDRDPVPSMMAIKKERLRSTPFPCGVCTECRVNKARMWQNRILLERYVHEKACFVTLTYNDDFVPFNCELNRRDFTLFLKKLRRRIEPRKIRYFAIGEYGEEGNRPLNPHYHLCIFGMDILDRDIFDSVWTFEGCPLGYVSVYELSRYLARYITNYNIKGWLKNDNWTDHQDRLNGRPPEFMSCSRKEGGIGIGAVKKIAATLKKDKYINDKVLLDRLQFGDGAKFPLGRYLRDKLAEELMIEEGYMEEILYDYQMEIFGNHLVMGEDFYFNVVDEKAQKRLVQEKRRKIWKQKKTL